MYGDVDSTSFLKKGAVLELMACAGGEGSVEPRKEPASLGRYNPYSDPRAIGNARSMRTLARILYETSN